MKRRYYELDALRGLSIIGVLLIHISASYFGNQDVFALLINQISRFAVPAFLFLSGIGLTLGNKYSGDYWFFICKQLSKVIPLFLVWNLIYFFTFSESTSIFGFILGFTLGTNYYHLYYVPITIFLYLIFPLLLKMTKKTYGIWVSLGITITSQLIALFTGMTLLNLHQNFFNWLFYFVFGIWMADDFEAKLNKIKEHKKSLIILLMITGMIVFLEPYLLSNYVDMSLLITSMRPIVILYSVVFILTILCVPLKNNVIKQSLLNLSSNSYKLYLSHLLVLELYEAIYVEMNFVLHSTIYIPIAFFIVLFFSKVVSAGIDLLIDPIDDKVQAVLFPFDSVEKTIEP